MTVVGSSDRRLEDGTADRAGEPAEPQRVFVGVDDVPECDAVVAEGYLFANCSSAVVKTVTVSSIAVAEEGVVKRPSERRSTSVVPSRVP